jgi:hypothetical protein
MTIDNGRRVRLFIERVFDGEAGESAGVVSFIAGIKEANRAKFATGGTIDGDPVRLTFIGREGPFVSYRYEARP